MRISFSTGMFYHRSIGYCLGLARDAGFDGIELAIGPTFIFGGEEAVMRASKRYGVPILSVHPPLVPVPFWPRTVNQRMQRLASMTRDFGAEVLVLHVPALRGEETPRATYYTALLGYGREVAGAGVRIALENQQYNMRSHRYLLDDLRTLVKFATERGCGVTFDTSHAGANGQDLFECLEILRPALCNVHLCDMRHSVDGAKTHLFPGEGELPLAGVLAELARSGYDGLITLEIHPQYVGLLSRGRNLQRLRQARQFIEQAIATSGVASEPAARATLP